MAAIFLKILNMSISASWIIMAIIVLRLILKKAPRFIHCIMWGLVGIRLVFPFSIESILSLVPSAETIPPTVIEGPSFDVNTGINFVDENVNNYLGDRYFEGVTVPENNGYNIMSIISIVWLVGIALMFIYTLVSYFNVHFSVKEAMHLGENIWLCDRINTPFILGVFRPRIFLPSAMEKEDVDYVIAHEKAHLKRKDHLWKPVGFVLLAVYWFNPLLWVAYILLCRDIEYACDEKVIKEMGNHQKKAYSNALINCSVPRKMLAACPLAFGEVGVKSRIKSVLSFKKPTVWIIIASILVVSTAAVCLLTNPKASEPAGASSDVTSSQVAETESEPTNSEIGKEESQISSSSSSKPQNSSKPNNSKDTTASQNITAISHSGTIKKGGVYTVGNKFDNETIITYKAGQKMPSKCSDADTYTFGDYVYSYYNNHYDYGCNGWKVEVLDKTKKEYGPILTSINNMPVVSLWQTFRDCKNLKVAPVIPQGVIVMEQTFMNCTSLKSTPIIPDKVEKLNGTFIDCVALETVTQFPKRVATLHTTFQNCVSLKNVAPLPNSTTSLYDTFKGCTSLEKSPKLPDGILSMVGAFYDCKSLKEIQSIPSKSQRFKETFINCSSLKSVPKFPASVIQFDHMFEGCYSLETVASIPKVEPEVISSRGGKIEYATVSFYKMFYGCTSLKFVPAIPDGVESIESAFENCTSLVSVPKLPDSIKNMSYAFRNCISLKTAPVIPKKVFYMLSTFEGCIALNGEVVLNTEYNLEGYCAKCFYNTVNPIKIVGKANSWAKKILSETANNNNVTCDEQFSFD